MKTVKQLVQLNLDDFKLYLGILLIPFLAVQLITAIIMVTIHPQDTVLLSGAMQTLLLGIVGFVAALAHGTISYPQFIQFSCTRKRGLLLFAGVLGMELGLCTLLSMLLVLLENFFSLPLCRMLSGYSVLYAEEFDVVWWAFLLAAVIGAVLGLLTAALFLRFGQKGLWFAWGLWMFGCFGVQFLPWKTHTITDWLIPLLVVFAIGALIWSVYVMLRYSLKQ